MRASFGPDLIHVMVAAFLRRRAETHTLYVAADIPKEGTDVFSEAFVDFI